MNHKIEIKSLKSFKIASGIFIPIAVISIIVIQLNSNLSWDFTFRGFSNTLIYYEFPMKVVAAYIAIVGLIGLNHRSQQTVHQIIISENQNNFNNYYKHMDEFIKYIQTMNNNLVPYVNYRFCHKTLFPDSTNGNLNVNQKTLLPSNKLRELIDYGINLYKQELVTEQQFNHFWKIMSQIELEMLGRIGVSKGTAECDYHISVENISYKCKINIGFTLVFNVIDAYLELMAFDTNVFSEDYSSIQTSVHSYLFSYFPKISKPLLAKNEDSKKLAVEFPFSEDLFIKKLTKIKGSLIKE